MRRGRPYIDPTNGKTFFVVRSISYAAMDQTRFDAFFDRACFVIAERWMPAGTTSEDVRFEILEMINPPSAPSIAPSQPAQSTERPDEPALSALGRGRARSEV